MTYIGKIRMPESTDVRVLRTDLLRHIAENESGSVQDLVRHMMALHPRKDAETIRKRIRGLALIGYVHIISPDTDNPTWRSTASGRSMADAMREPTFVDGIKGWLLRHYFGFRIDL